MSSDSPHPRKTVSSQLGRRWLENSDDRSKTGTATPSEADPTFIVSIPDVGATLAGGFSEFEAEKNGDPDAIADALSQATEKRLKELGDALSDQLDLSSVADLPEKASDWTEKSPPDEEGRSGEKTKSKSDHNAAIERFVDLILERFPISQPVALLFVGSESNPHTDETCARVSSILADRNIGRILLLDSDFVGKELSNASGQLGTLGISDVLNHSTTWKSAVCKSPSGMDFISCGVESLGHQHHEETLRKAVAEMKTDYQFICVSAGDAHSPAAHIWNDVCEGSYLLVSMKNSNETIARSAVAEFQASGARLLGCVVTDAE